MVGVDGLELSVRNRKPRQYREYRLLLFARRVLKDACRHLIHAAFHPGGRCRHERRILDSQPRSDPDLGLAIGSNGEVGRLILHQQCMKFVDERKVEHRAATNADALEAVLECCDVAFGDPHVRRQASSTVRGLVGEQLAQVRFGALDLRTHDSFATCERAGHHVGIRKVLESALQAAQGGVCLWEARFVPTA